MQFGPWNPGIESQIPNELRPLATIFRPENVFTSVERADEMVGRKFEADRHTVTLRLLGIDHRA